jgi:hypothetical protein
VLNDPTNYIKTKALNVLTGAGHHSVKESKLPAVVRSVIEELGLRYWTIKDGKGFLGGYRLDVEHMMG